MRPWHLKNVNTPKVVPGNDPGREIFTLPYTMDMKISSHWDAMRSFIYTMVIDHLLTVASSTRKHLKCSMVCTVSRNLWGMPSQRNTSTDDMFIWTQTLQTVGSCLTWIFISCLLSSDAAPNAVQCWPLFWLDPCTWPYKHWEIRHHLPTHSPSLLIQNLV